MSHGDTITRLPEGFHATAQTDSTPYAGLDAPARNLYGIQFHPEVVHTPRGREVLRNFVTGIAGIAPNWTPANFVESTVAEIRERVDAPRAGDRLRRQGHLRAVGRRRLGGRGGARPSRRRRPADLHLRRPRADAQEGVGAAAGDLRGQPRHAPVMVDARERFLARLAGVTDPEQKRRIIGDEFIRVFEEEAAKTRGGSTS